MSRPLRSRIPPWLLKRQPPPPKLLLVAGVVVGIACAAAFELEPVRQWLPWYWPFAAMLIALVLVAIVCFAYWKLRRPFSAFQTQDLMSRPSNGTEVNPGALTRPESEGYQAGDPFLSYVNSILPTPPPEATPALADALIDARIARQVEIDPSTLGEIHRVRALISTDPDMALAKARVLLERIAVTLFDKTVGKVGTRPLDALLRELSKSGILPRKVYCLCEVVRELGNVGVHPILDDEKVTHREAQISLLALLLVVEWYERRAQSTQVE
jgi:hypothetical protein